ncbi:M56 family metallopeptidase [Metallumcola ferriviriculae]|uniref:M56 family metallopeptidase n=1 Tax=Metallumcola ferriviriculae TaxID=3039180 RepID=A0AAU0UI44_9FIRM|nr:M56 family metallopeptidase [Desulfitibacteraceae bacterium MK1]
MSLIYAFTHTFASYVLFGGMFVYLTYLVCSKLLSNRCSKLRSGFMWFALLIPFITYFALKVLFPRIGNYHDNLISGTFWFTLFDLACQVGYWTSLILTPLVFAWVAVIGIRIFYVFLSGHKFRQINRTARKEDYHQLFSMIDEGAARLGIKSPEVFVLAGWPDTFTFGIFRPAVVFGEDMLGLDDQDLRAVIAHELAHIYRKDALLSVIAAFMRDLMFFSPISHWAFNGLMTAKEEMADDIASKLVGDRLQYGSTLIKVWKLFNGGNGSVNHNVYPAMGMTQGNLTRRVERLVNPGRMTALPKITFLVMGLVIINLLSFIC